jgi:hypothetical protein
MGKLKFRNVKFGRRNCGYLMAMFYMEGLVCFFMSILTFFAPTNTINYTDEIHYL